MSALMSFDEARAASFALGAASRCGSEPIPLAEIVGRVSAQKVVAPMAHPRFDNSAMDGYAVRAADVPGPLRVRGRQIAGAAPIDVPLVGGDCYAVMTGAPIPPGADAVVPVEDTALEGERVHLHRPVSAGAFIRRAGADYSIGDEVVGAGERLGPSHVLALATLGVPSVAVARLPVIEWITTGREVVRGGGALAATEIYDATGPYALARLATWGLALRQRAPIGDDPSALRAALQQSDADVVLSTGAVSMGDHDFVPEVLSALGAEVIFHRVAIRPGKPLLLARLPSGAPFVGLPGNPASSATCLELFVRPLLEAMQGLAPQVRRYGGLRAPYHKGPHRLRMLARAALTFDASGRCEVEVIADQPSFRVSPFVRSNGWVEIGEDEHALDIGAIVPVHPD